jgi:SsrA-binding protein
VNTKKSSSESDGAFKVVVFNKKAQFNYHLLEKFEAGLVLRGDEIKAIREGGVSLAESFIRPHNGELWLVQAHIKPYSHTGAWEHDPVRKRKLLMHGEEIRRLQGKVEQKGLTIVPVRLYLKRGRAKLEIALAKGKDAPDKRTTVVERDQKREAQRAIKQSR